MHLKPGSTSCDRALSVLRDLRRSSNCLQVYEEQRQRFAPYNTPSDKGKRKKAKTTVAQPGFDGRSSQWAHKFVCLSSRNQGKVPSPHEKGSLQACGWGEKSISFPSLDLTYGETMDVLVSHFPKLSKAGGVDFCKSPSNTRDLVIIPLTSGGIPYQLQMKGGHGRIYIRPIQADLDLVCRDDDEDDTLAVSLW